MINERARYTAVNGMALISTANTNLDGTGTLVSVLVPSATNGTIINRIIVKAIGNTTRGMVRLFVANHGSYYLLKEIPVPAVNATASEIDPHFFKVTFDLNFDLINTTELWASTEKSESFQVIAEGLSWGY